MVFSSIPAYGFDPSNWQQLPNHQLVSTGLSDGISPSLPPPAHQASALQAQSPGSSINPGSMAECARLANIPVPEPALKCPRCESTNTKFCYFNNYSLTQPRHFCKTCRRYWTRGGALRNVPVGGGCRRNTKKSSKSKENRSKSPATSNRQSGGISSTNTSTALSRGSASADALVGLSGQVSPPLSRLMAPNLVHHFGDNFGFGGEINGLNNSYRDMNISPTGGARDLNFHVDGSMGVGSPGFFGGSVPHSIGFFPFGGGYIESGGASVGGEKMPVSGLSHLSSSMKSENNLQELNLSRRFLGLPGKEQQMGFDNGAANAWTSRCAGFSSSSMNAF